MSASSSSLRDRERSLLTVVVVVEPRARAAAAASGAAPRANSVAAAADSPPPARRSEGLLGGRRAGAVPILGVQAVLRRGRRGQRRRDQDVVVRVEGIREVLPRGRTQTARTASTTHLASGSGARKRRVRIHGRATTPPRRRACDTAASLTGSPRASCARTGVVSRRSSHSLRRTAAVCATDARGALARSRDSLARAKRSAT